MGGVLAVSRAFGDRLMKKYVIAAEIQVGHIVFSKPPTSDQKHLLLGGNVYVTSVRRSHLFVSTCFFRKRVSRRMSSFCFLPLTVYGMLYLIRFSLELPFPGSIINFEVRNVTSEYLCLPSGSNVLGKV